MRCHPLRRGSKLCHNADMNRFRFILASLWQYRRVHLAVAAGVAVATAVITGALLVGDSVRGSLRDLVLERLGGIDQLLVAEQPFRQQFANELGAQETSPLLMIPGSLASSTDGESRNATQLSIIGHTDDFWQFDPNLSPAPLKRNQAALSRSVAAELQVKEGDDVLLRTPTLDSMPADSVLGEKSDTVASRRLEVAAILPDEGLARFGIRPSQQPPRNVFVQLKSLQDLLDLTDKANAIAVDETQVTLAPTLEDFGVTVSTENTGPSNATEYRRLTAERLVLPSAVAEAFATAFPNAKVQPAITYLANTIKLGDQQIPYSTVTGIDSLAGIGPLLGEGETPIILADDEIVINDWAANDLGAKIGDTLTLTHYEPETTHGQLREAEPVTLTLRAIVPLHDAAGNDTTANDPKLTPDLPGVTDQRSISDWDLPFELVEEIRRVDEDYWDDYSTTPKAFVSYQLAKKLWSSRWGTDSLLRVPASAGLSIDQITEQLKPDPAEMGMTLLPIKEQGLAASRGTTAFEGLFIGFSFFLMASAVMLIALLFRLGVESRANELGVLATSGWNAALLRRTWLGEAIVVALIGAIVGVVAGIGYARLMIHGLSTWWVAATVTPFLTLHVVPTSLALGFGIGILVAMATIAWSLRKLIRLPVRQLLAGDCADPADLAGAAARGYLSPTLLVAAVGLGGWATRLEGEAQAGAFFGGGALVLTALLIWLRQRLRRPSLTQPHALSLFGLAARNARRYPSRTLLSVALAAVASFLIIALSAFRLAPTEQGTGGYDLIATSDQPLHFDLNTNDGREELGFQSKANDSLSGSEIASFRIQGGEDASCLNLYQTAQPEIVGVPPSFGEKGATTPTFGWSASAGLQSSAHTNWMVLQLDLGNDDAGQPIVPMVLDKNTAAYSLHLGGIGSQLTIEDGYGQPVTLEIVGLLANSVLQGKVMIAESHFLRLFPDTSGHQLFLIRKGSSELAIDQLSTLLETQLEDYGFDAVSAEEQLAGFLAVQNTYLSTFQSLGALGLLLGTLGLAIAQLRSILQRRGEIALLRSSGFRSSRLAELVLGENAVLLIAGLGIGTVAALVAVLPHYLLQAAGTPWKTLFVLLAAVVVAGLLAGWLAVRAAVKAPIVPSLRGD